MSRVDSVTNPRTDPYDDEPSGRSAPSPLAMIHECLKGRYLLAFALLVAGALMGAALGYKLAPPLFATTAQIQIKPILPRILYENEQNSAIPRFDNFVESQLSLIRSNRVIDAAMQRPEWKDKKVTPPTNSEMYTGMSAWRTKNGEVLSVYMEHRNPRVAFMCVQTIVKTYVDMYVTADNQSLANRLEVLENRRTELTKERDELQAKILAMAQEYGSGSLEPIYHAKLSELNKLDSELNRIRLAIAHIDAAAAQPDSQPQAAAPLTPLTPELAAMESSDVRAQLRSVRAAQFELEGLVARLGARHIQVVEQRRVVEQLQMNLEEAMRAYELSRTGGVGPDGGKLELVSLRNSEKRIQQLYDALKEETVALGRKQLQIDALRGEVTTVSGRLKEVDNRIDQINVESALSGRISVITYGDPPKTPVKDRRTAFAAAGGLGGGAIGPALLILLGLLDGRFRSTTDARSKLRGPIRILGALPYLPDGATDPEELASAAHGIHQIRVLLQVQASREGHRVFALTSSSPGVGKTSIALALGYSFAGSSSRTLLIDLDLISGGLSARTAGLPRLPAPRLMQPATSSGLRFVPHPQDSPPQPADADEAATYVTPVHQLDEFDGSLQQGFETVEGSGGNRSAVPAPSTPPPRVGVAHGIPLAAREARQARGESAQPNAGLLDVMEGMPLGDCLTQTEEPNLSVLPLGGAGPQHVSRLSPDLLRRIIREARGRYDTVLIDTGPVMGSIEAAMVASEVDAVLMAVSRGEQRSLTEQAMDLVLSTGARLGGIIFNRAASVDVMMSGSSNRSGFAGAAVRFGGARGPRAGQLGPLAGAVVTSGQSAN
jgi:Mrp family chromosome partitioning ATPase/uncharacterized protein involved in exopolysaccharide biosynthesis